MATKPVDVLFAISDTGGGHRSAAVAISAALDEVSGESLSWAIEDVLRLTDVPMVRSAPDMYAQLSTRWIRLYDLTFQLTNEVRVVDMVSRLVFLRARRNIAQLLYTTRPRVVVVTHPLVHRFVCATRKRYNIPCRVVTVVTDLVSLHASWTYPGVDLCLIPTDEAYKLMRRRKMRPSKMKRTGFPVHPKFARYDHTQAEARAELGIDTSCFTVMVTSGGVGSGRLHELVEALEQAWPDKQLLVITGKNRTLYAELTNAPRKPRTHIFGFVDNMETLMAASDIVITKAGPGTLMEALVMRRPVVVTEAVGIQERGNIDFVLNYELGLFCPTIERTVEAVGNLTDAENYAATVRRLENAVPRDGAVQIARIAAEQAALAQSYALPDFRKRRRPPFYRRRRVQYRFGLRSIQRSWRRMRR